MSDERRKRTWKEIDAAKDKSGHRREERPQGGGRRTGRSQKSYRAALDRLFDSGKIGDLVEERTGQAADDGDPSRQKLLRAIRDAEDKASITEAVDAYLAAHDQLPDDPDILGKALSHKQPGRQLDAMEALLAALDAGRTPRRARGIIGQLKLIRDTSGDPELEQLASQLLDRLE